MPKLGPTVPFYLIVIIWLIKTTLLVLICVALGWLGIRVLDVLTPHIHERQKIGENPVSIGLFIAGFFIFVGLVIHGAATGPEAVGGSLLGGLVNPIRLGLIAVSFLVSLLLGIALFDIIDRLTPKIPFATIAESSMAIGIYMFGYLVFFGLIIHAALTMSL